LSDLLKSDHVDKDAGAVLGDGFGSKFEQNRIETHRFSLKMGSGARKTGRFA